jgi:ATP-dependent Clp protease ATP-binding subunit ClpA
VLVTGEGAEQKLDFEIIPGEPKPPKASEEDEGDEDLEEDVEKALIEAAAPRKALPGPKDKPVRRTTGTVPTVPRKTD